MKDLQGNDQIFSNLFLLEWYLLAHQWRATIGTVEVIVHSTIKLLRRNGSNKLRRAMKIIMGFTPTTLLLRSLLLRRYRNLKDIDEKRSRQLINIKEIQNEKTQMH